MEPATPIVAPPQLSVVAGGNREASPASLPTQWLVGFSSYTIFAWLYDFPLYALVIWHLGPLWGGLAMTALTIPVDLYCLRLYDWSQKDWLAIEFIKSQKGYRGTNIFRLFARFVLTRTPIPVQILLLSVKFNAFIITALLREGDHQFNGLSSRDWRIFWFSFLTSQLYWIAVVATGIEGVQFLTGQ